MRGAYPRVDVLGINTCGFIQPAKEEALEVIRKALVAKGRGRVGRVVVAGCLSQRMGAELGKEAEGIDAIVGLGERDKIAAIVAKAAEGRETEQPAVYLGRKSGSVAKDRGRLLIGAGHSAYLRISEGCNRRCSFCTIPSIRGRFHSKRKAEIVAEAKELAANGVRELILIAQDSTSWGRDLGIKDGLPGLLEDLHAIDGPRWIRLGSPIRSSRPSLNFQRLSTISTCLSSTSTTAFSARCAAATAARKRMPSSSGFARQCPM